MKAFGINLSEGSEIGNVTIASGNTFPSNANAGEMFWKTGSNAGFHIHNGTAWITVASDPPLKVVTTTVTSNGSGVWTASYSGFSSVSSVMVQALSPSASSTMSTQNIATLKSFSTTTATGYTITSATVILGGSGLQVAANTQVVVRIEGIAS